MHLAYRGTFNDGDKIKYSTARQCYYCSNFYGRKDKYERHIENCTGQPGIIYDLSVQNLVTFEDNLKHKGDLPLTAYIDFETTAPTDSCLNPEDKNMFAVLYVKIFAFHPKLNFERVTIERSFSHSTEKRLTLDYLTRDQMQFLNKTTLLQLRDAACNVSTRKDQLAKSTMFNIEIIFAALPKWFNAKAKSRHLELDPFEKINFQKENPIDWEKDKCCICNFSIDVNPKCLQHEEVNMSHFDFLIRKELAFLRKSIHTKI